MDIEKGSVKRQKKCSKLSRSSSSSSEDNNSGSSRRKRRLKESKLTKNDGKELTRTDVEGNNGDEFGRKIKGRKRRGKVKRKEESEDSSSPSSSESKRRRKKKRKEKKRKEKKKKKIKKKEKELKKQEGSIVKIKAVISENEGDKEGQQEDILSGPKPMKSTEEPRRVMVPMTKEEYEKQQSQVRRVFDPDTGRERLVKGDGEIVEEVVSYERHKEINKLSTIGDGAAFQKSLGFNRYTDNKIYRC